MSDRVLECIFEPVCQQLSSGSVTRRAKIPMAMYTSSYINKALATRPEGPRHEGQLDGEKTIQPAVARFANLAAHATQTCKISHYSVTLTTAGVL